MSEHPSPRTGAGRGIQRNVVEPDRLHYSRPGCPDGPSAVAVAPAARRNQAARAAKAQSIASSHTSTSTRIKGNKLATQQRIEALRTAIDSAKQQLEELEADKKAAEDKLEVLTQLEHSDPGAAEIATIKLSLIELQRDITKKEKDILRLQSQFERRERLIRMEEDLNNDIIQEENENPDQELDRDHGIGGNLDDLAGDPGLDNTKRIQNWIADNGEGCQQPVALNSPQLPHLAVQNQATFMPPQSPVPHLTLGNPSTATTYPQQGELIQLATAINNLALNSNRASTFTKKDTDLPTFSGKPEDWPIFESEFNRTTAKLPQYEANSINLIRLRKCLKGVAEDTIRHLLTKPENVPVIIQTLRGRFGQAKFVLEALAKKVKAATSPNSAKPETIIDFGISIQALVTTIKSYDEMAYLHSVDLLSTLMKKLPPDLRTNWYTWLDDNEGRKEDLETFNVWITKKVNIAYRDHDSCPTPTEEKPAKRNRHVGAAAAGDEKRKGAFCVNCKLESHHIRECRKFASLNMEEKLELVKEKRLCFSCLRSGHRTSECNSKKQCSMSGCSRHHHPTLHVKEGSKPSQPRNKADSSEAPEAPTSTHIGTVNKRGDDLLWYVPVIVRGPTGSRSCYAMIDNGAQPSLIDEDLAKELGLTGRKEVITIGSFDGKEKKQDSLKFDIEISGDFPGAKFHKVTEVNTTPILDLPAQSYDAEEVFRKYPRLRGAPLKSLHNAKPLIMIGNNKNNWRIGFPQVKLEQSATSPAAIKTKLGWLLAGSEGKSTMSRRGFFHVRINPHDEELNKLVKDFICLDNFGVKDLPSLRSKEDNKAIAIMESTTRKVGQRFETGLLWRDESTFIPASKEAALKRHYFTERKADKSKEYADLYTSRFQEYISQGFLKKVDQPWKGKQWFLPHFFATHENKKPRLVYDAAAKANGKSFNDFFYTGPDLLVPLPQVILRFRRHKIGLIGDVTAMFHQVQLRECDRSMQTVLYRGMDRTRQPDEYQMQVLFFGSVCSPASAIYVMNKNAMQFEEEFPTAVKAITSETYMDDFHSGADTEEDAIRLHRDVTHIHKEGGFPITKWNSSSLAVVNGIPPELRAVGDKVLSTKSDLPMEKTLGLLWSPSEDAFKFSVNPEKISAAAARPTKRKLASFIMSLFDPLGFITPMKIKGLIIFQSTWRSGIGWDDEVTSQQYEVWKDWLNELKQVDTISIPRCVRMTSNCSTTYQLHTFCDASEEAYVAVTYLRGSTGSHVEVAFIAGKGRVAPIKGLSIPRMELNAALLGARLASAVKKAYGVDLPITASHYWSDSRTVLCWLRSETGRFSQWVSNRIGEVLSTSNPEEWSWVPSKDNVADDATRSGKHIDFTSSCRWLTGSDFLLSNEDGWPPQNCLNNEVKEDDLEKKASIFTVTKKNTRLPLPSVDDYSCWYTLIRKTARWIAAFGYHVKKREAFHVTVNDLEKASTMWLTQLQRDSFAVELWCLQRGRPVEAKSKLFKLTPVLKDGLIVLQGRISQAPHVSTSVKHPIVLDPNHRATKLLVRWYHIRNAHQGQEAIINQLRQKFWILDCRTLVRSITAKCMDCKIQRAKPVPQLMGELPEGRMSSHEPPFTHTGVDLFGPMEVTIGRRREKRWGVLYTCLTTRAVYIDLVPSLSTSDFIDCLIRFNSRRGPASHIWSDNGTNLRGADNEIKLCIQQWNSKQIEKSLHQRGLQWHFIAPASPHMGGSYEKMIGIAKKILHNLLKSQAPKEYTLLTLLAEVEAIMNSRPLSVTSPDAKDPECLTPNHLLKLRCVPGQSISGSYLDGGTGRKMWRYAQQLADEFWNRWKLEVLPNLIPRPKWNKEQQPLREGDIVILLDDQADRNDWKKGVVESVHRGRDNRVRVVDVRIPVVNKGKDVTFKSFRRHIMKVCPLDLNINDKTSSYGREEYLGVSKLGGGNKGQEDYPSPSVGHSQKPRTAEAGPPE